MKDQTNEPINIENTTIAIQGGSIQAGLNGTSEFLASFPSTMNTEQFANGDITAGASPMVNGFYIRTVCNKYRLISPNYF